MVKSVSMGLFGGPSKSFSVKGMTIGYDKSAGCIVVGVQKGESSGEWEHG